MRKIKYNINLSHVKLIKNSLRLRLFLLISIMIIMAVSLVGLIGFKTFEKTLVEEIGNNRVDVLTQIGERAKIIKNSANTLSNLYFYDKKINDNLNSNSPNKKELNQYLEEITEKYNISFNEVGMYYYVVITTEDGYNYYSGIGEDEYDYIQAKKKVWYKDIFVNKGEIYWVSSFKDVHRQENVFSAARVLRNDTGNSVGVLLVNVNERLLYETYENVLTDTNSIYIVDEEGSIISSRDERMLGMNFFHIERLRELFSEKPYTIINIGGRKVLFTSYIEETTGWTILEEIPISEVIRPIVNVKNIILVLTLTIIAMGTLLAYNYANKVVDPIKKLCDFLQGVQDEHFHIECEVEGWTEINILSKGLNSMLVRIKNLLDDIKQKEEQKRQLELSFLQAQINPHFMYNTLFSIKCMVEMEKNEEAEKMLTAFIQLLRNTLSDPNEFITLEEEFNILKQYILLQKFRYNDQFEVEFIYSQDVLKYRIPKLLIQPLVENAIFHGVEIKKGEGSITISAEEKEGDIYIMVEDNGVGITKDVIDKIEKGVGLSSENHVGIFNIKERIHLNFGNHYGLKVESKEWKGTKIILKLPIIE